MANASTVDIAIPSETLLRFPQGNTLSEIPEFGRMRSLLINCESVVDCDRTIRLDSG